MSIAYRTCRARIAALVTVTLVTSLANVGGAAGTSIGHAAVTPTGSTGTTVRPAPPMADALPADWRTSTDVAWTTAGDATGLHLLVAASRDGYRWRTAATLVEPGYDTDRWVGNACLTGSGTRAVVVYAPRAFTNRERLFQRGAYAAVVDLTSGRVTKLGIGVSLAYHNPGCGAGETAVLTQAGATDLGRTRLHVLDTAAGRVTHRHELTGQVTSAVPVADGVVAAGPGGLILVSAAGATHVRAATRGTPYDVHADATGAVAYLEQSGPDTATARYVGRTGRPRDLATGGLTTIGLTAGTGGRVFLTGTPRSTASLPASVTAVGGAVGDDISTEGRLVVRHATPGRPGPGTQAVPGTAAAPGTPAPVTLTGTVRATGRTFLARVDPDPAAADPTPGPAGGARAAVAAGSPTDPVDSEATCAMPRNDVRTQIYQPHWTQVEWAANLAIQNALTVSRPANWKQSGVPTAWSPQGMFPRVDLVGGGRIPAQIILGVLAQESNLWQASFHVVEGVTGNPLIGNYYGTSEGGGGDPWTPDFADADCGYGVGQVTDNMRKGQLDPVKQRAITVDYATNIAASVQILASKWNQLQRAGIRINDNNPSKPENWFAAVWAYNSGVNPQASTGNTSGCTPGPACTDAQGMWGLGYTNNPANADYPRNRRLFLEAGQDDARHPQHWPYPEKVLGWAAYPIVKYELSDGSWHAGYAQAWWTSETSRSLAKPPVDAFCSTANRCDVNRSGEACTLTNFHCWWHDPVTYRPNCTETCGNEIVRYSPGAAEPPDANNNYPARCSLAGLAFPNDSDDTNDPADFLVVDNVPTSVVSPRPCARGFFSNQGDFSLTFASNATGLFPSKVDFHQIGAGFGGHFWFAHTRTSGQPTMKVTGTWRLNRSLNQWARVLVHIPDHGAHTQQAAYTVSLGNGEQRTRTLLQRTQENRWVSLGVFRFAGTPSVTLSSVTRDGTGVEDVAWDAIAFQPLAAKPTHQVVALGDSFSSGEGASDDPGADYYQETEYGGGTPLANVCHRSRHAWSRKAVPSDAEPGSIGVRADTWDRRMDYHFLACSGAETENLLTPGVRNAFGQAGTGQYRDLSQVERGFLDENTTLVTFSIGGNDARFSKVVTFCALGTPNGDANCKDQIMPGDTQDLDAEERRIIAGPVRESVRTVLREVHRLAPNAKIVVMGYPRLFDSWVVPCLPTLFPAEMNWINDMVDVANRAFDDLVVAAGVEDDIPVIFADPTPFFVGQGACSTSAAINGIVAGKTPGEDQSEPISRQSVHPNKRGTDNYGRALTVALHRLDM